MMMRLYGVATICAITHTLLAEDKGCLKNSVEIEQCDVKILKDKAHRSKG
jgi:hypothetical protein